MIAPSPLGGRTTEQVGYFHVDVESFASWLRDGMGAPTVLTTPHWVGLDDLCLALAPARAVSRYACVPMDGGWTALFNNSPLGTDVGVLPSLAARELGISAIRAVCTADADRFPARILEVFGPDGSPPLLLRRSIVAANDGGRWVFETSGAQLEFEDDSSYGIRRKADRFPAGVLERYLRALGIPVDSEPRWNKSVVVELRSK